MAHMWTSDELNLGLHLGLHSFLFCTKIALFLQFFGEIHELRLFWALFAQNMADIRDICGTSHVDPQYGMSATKAAGLAERSHTMNLVLHKNCKKLQFFQENRSNTGVLSVFGQNHGTYTGDVAGYGLAQKLQKIAIFLRNLRKKCLKPRK